MPHVKSKPGWLSVTEVLSLAIAKPFLEYWRGKHGNKLCEQIKRESQELGIQVHEAIESKFKNDDGVPITTNAFRMLTNVWNEFVTPWEAKPLKLEETYKDKKLKLQGTLDAILETNKGTYIVDFKTSNTLDKVSVPLQLSAYAHLCGEGIWKGLAVRIDKEKDKVEIKEYPDLEKYWPIFLNALKLAKYIKWGLNEPTK